MLEEDRPTIEHNRYELPNDTTPWRWLFLFLAVIWAWDIYDNDPTWGSVVLGLGTGALIASWAIVRTGGKVPESWRSPSNRR